MNNQEPVKGRPVIFGEVLFDRFPDGTEVLGGAPFNVAWHLQGFRCAPLFVSRIGADEPGQRVQQAMQAWGLDTAGLQIDPKHPTGLVEISFAGKLHSFDILPDRAYDHIDAGLSQEAIQRAKPALLYHGTLVIRTPKVRQVLDRLLASHAVSVFVDVNLRDPWWQEEDLPRLMERARWVKVNDEELKIIANRLGLRTTDLKETAQRLQAAYRLDTLIVTLGEHGAMALDLSQELVRVEPEQDAEIIDTVGAGDAFSSVVLLGFLEEWPLLRTLQRAQAFASLICGQRGATRHDVNMYQTLMNAWSNNDDEGNR